LPLGIEMMLASQLKVTSCGVVRVAVRPTTVDEPRRVPFS
jgi:hypothetical protein